MPLTYPLAETARGALDALSTARTVGEARDKAGAPVSLVSDWLRPSAAERRILQHQIDAGVAAGFIQVYEDNQGQPVFAIAFWKRGVAPPAPPPLRRETEPDVLAKPPNSGDTVDDLYFERSRRSRRAGGGRRSRAEDPNQLDLFVRAGQQGDETTDPAHPIEAPALKDAAGPVNRRAAIPAGPAEEAKPGESQPAGKAKGRRKPKTGV